MESSPEQAMHDRHLTSDAIGMLILNELKCFKSEIIKEVKTLTEVLQKVMATQSTLQTSDFSEEQEGNSKDHEKNVWKADDQLTFKNQYEQLASVPEPKHEGFREILPGSRDDILNNHIAFRMSSSFEPNHEQPREENFSRNSLSENERFHDFANQTHQVFLPAERKALSEPETPLPLPIPLPINVSQASHKILSQEKSPPVKKKPVKYSVIYKCNTCPEQFTTQSLYNQHFYNVHCDVDSANSCAADALWDDQTLFTALDYQQPKIIYVCGTCSRHFSAKGSLLRHNTLHSGVRKFVCKICGKAFFRSDHLKSHLPTHTRQKSFCCHICDKYFLRPQTLYKHMKAHEEETESTVACYEGYQVPEEDSRSGEGMLMKVKENDKQTDENMQC